MQRPADLVVGKDERAGLPNPGRPHLAAAAALATRGDRRGRAAARPRRDARAAGSCSSSTATARTSGTFAARRRPRRSGSRRSAAWSRTGRTRRRPSRPTARPSRSATAGTSGSRRSTAARRRAASCAPAPRSGSTTTRLLGVVGREGSSHLVALRPRRTRGRSRSRTATATAAQATVSPDRTQVAFTFWPHDDRNRSEIHVLDLATGATRALTGTPRMQDKGPAWSPDGTHDRVRLRAQRLVRDPSRRRERAARTASSPTTTRTSASSSGTPTARGSSRPAPAAATATSSPSTRRSGAVTELAPGGVWQFPHWLPDGTVGRDLRGPRDRAAHRAARRAGRAAPGPCCSRRRRPRSRARPHVTPEEVTYRSFDGLEIHGFLFRPAGASADAPVAGRRLPARRTDRRVDRRVGRPRAVLRRPGLRLVRAQLPRQHRLRPRLRAREPRRLGRRRHQGLPRRVRPPRHARLGRPAAGRDRRRVVRLVHGAAAAADDPEHRFAAAVCKYGDCDLKTSWAMGDREGRQDMERMMSTPFLAPARDPGRLARPPPRQHHDPAAHRARRARRPRRPRAVRGARHRAAQARQDVRVRHVPERGPRLPPPRAVPRLLPPPRQVPRLVHRLTPFSAR